jgi:hypothetical protein
VALRKDNLKNIFINMPLIVIDALYFSEIQENPAKIFYISTLEVLSVNKIFVYKTIQHFLETIEFTEDNLTFLIYFNSHS